MLTEKDFCDYKTCVALKEFGITYFGLHFYKIGYPETLHHNYMQYMTERTAGALGRVLAIPLYSAQKWLREEKKIEANAFYDNKDVAWRFYVLEIDSPDLSGTHTYNDAYMSYEEALSEGIKAAIKLLKEEY